VRTYAIPAGLDSVLDFTRALPVGLSHAADSRLAFGGFLLDRCAEDLLLMLVCAEMKKPPSP
jgi:hypothetical protein